MPTLTLGSFPGGAWQGALGATLAAMEAHAKSTLTYRETKAGEVYGAKLEIICGKNGIGGTWPFEVKKRSAREGGNWTFSKSVAIRRAKPNTIYKRGVQAISCIQNVINPLFLKLFPKAEIPSGNQWEDVVLVVEYNLELIAQAKKAAKKAKAGGIAGGGGFDEGEEGEEGLAEGMGFVEQEEEGEEGEDGDGDGNKEAGKDAAPREAAEEAELVMGSVQLESDVSKVKELDPTEFHNKNPFIVAWVLHSYPGDKSAECIKAPEREDGSGRIAQRAKAEKNAETRRTAAAAEENEETLKRKASEERVVIDLASKLHYNANQAFYQQRKALKEVWKMSPAEEKEDARKAYAAHVAIPPPKVEDFMEQASGRKSTRSNGSPSGSSEHDASVPP